VGPEDHANLHTIISSNHLEQLSYDEIIQAANHNQATLVIGVIGHVAHGKTTLVKAITGISTSRFEEEMKRGITIHIGNANAKIWKCVLCPAPDCYVSTGSQLNN